MYEVRTRPKGGCCFFSTAVNLQPTESAHTCFRGKAVLSRPDTNSVFPASGFLPSGYASPLFLDFIYS